MTRERDYRGKMYPAGRGVVHIHSTRKTYPAWLTDCVSEQTKIEQHETLPPGGADYLAYNSALTKTIERSAGRFRATPVCLPQAADWLRERIRATTEDHGQDAVIVLYRPTDY